jgi:hypothetical protein
MAAAQGRVNKLSADLGAAAISLLLDLVDAERPVLSGEALRVYFPESGGALLAAGLLTAEGHDAVQTSDDHDDAPVRLWWSAEHQNHGYFSATSGWVTVDPAAVAQYRVDIGEFCRRLGLDDRPLKAAVRSIGPGNVIWDLGDVRLPHRTHRTPVWFVRCIGDDKAWRACCDLASARAADRVRVLLTAAPRKRIPDDAPPGHVVVSLSDVLTTGGALAIDKAVLARRLIDPVIGGRRDEALVIEADGHVVRFFGKEFRFPKSQRQREIILYLDRRYQEGRSFVSVAEIVTQLDLPISARIRDYFKGAAGKRTMSELLFEKEGMCGFRFEDAQRR